jgi:WD40 repeat protein
MLYSGRSFGTIRRLEDTIDIWNTVTGKHEASLPGNSGGTYRLALSSDGRLLASIGRGKPGLMRVWNLSSRLRLFEVATQDSLHCAIFSSDCWLILSGGDDGAIHVWETLTGGHVCALAGHRGAVYSIVSSPDSAGFVSGGDDTTLLFWKPLKDQWMQRVAARQLAKRGLPEAWNDLANRDARIAYEGIRVFLDAAPAAIAFLQKHLRPTPMVDSREFQALLDNLDAADFVTRNAASSRL